MSDQIVSTKHMVQCANCGGQGHIYKSCNHPITSYGIICFRIVDGQNLQYLMVQRKDSLSYVEFIRGKYSIDQKTYIMKLFSNMTASERRDLLTKPFDHLWKQLWQSETCRSFVREYHEAQIKFEMLRSGYIMKNNDNQVYYFDIEFIMNHTTCNLDEPEWGFPKGRRNINERDLHCAIREFKEETGISPRNIHVIGHVKPVEEVFSGSNKVRYKHVYYVASSATCVTDLFNPKNKIQSQEIKDVRWFDYNEAQKRIDDYNIERKELFKRINAIVKKLIITVGPYTNHIQHIYSNQPYYHGHPSVPDNLIHPLKMLGIVR